jgi:hypothetical protein
VREGSVWTTDPEYIRCRQELAHSYVDYADNEAFVRDIRVPEQKDDAKDAEDTEGSDSSQDEEEAEDAHTEALE